MDISQILSNYDIMQEKNKKIKKCKQNIVKSNNDTEPDKIFFYRQSS